MPIPPLDSRGLLPPGRHSTSLSELKNMFAHNQRRDDLYYKLEAFIQQELLRFATGFPLIIGGSYLTDKPYPGDIEATLIIDLSALSNNADLVAFLNNLDVLHFNFKTQYEIDFYPSLPGLNQFDQFFQYVGPKTASIKGLDEKDTRGVLEVIL